MAASINIPAYTDALIVLGTAGIVVPMALRWGLSPVIGYLGAGALLGPLGLGSFADRITVLQWLTITDSRNVAGIADLGVVFLLFVIGLELSYERLRAMRRLVFGLGGLQVLLSAAAIGAIAGLAGMSTLVAIMLGACLALSSTAIVLEVLSSHSRLTSAAGRASFGILLAQDLAVIPILIFISVLGADAGQSVFSTVSTALLHAAAAVALIVGVGRTMLRPLFRLVGATKSNELFIAAILFVIVATGVVAAVAGLSMALGAFVAGVLLAETEYRRAIEATVEPFKGLLIGIFFFTVGMSIDLRELARNPVWLLAAAIGLIALKATIIIGLGRLYKLSWSAAVEAGLLLGPVGEFAFVGIGLAKTLGIATPQATSFTLAVTSLTMAMIPALGLVARRIGPYLDGPKDKHPGRAALPPPQRGQAIVVGYGRVGKDVCTMLDRHQVAYIALDHDADSVAADRARGDKVHYGDATSTALLRAAGLMDASGVIITIHTQARIDDIVAEVRSLRPDILIVSRARDADHARHLYSIGVTDAVPETIEASLQLSEAVLVGLGIPTGPVIASIHERRDEFRQELQAAATQAGLNGTRAVRATALRREPPASAASADDRK